MIDVNVEFAVELFSAPWWSALLAIILIDLVLAGDNAILIALAARNLPPALQRKAIIWGTVGAIVVRSVMTLCVVWLLQIPGLMLVGGLGLLWIAYQLLGEQAGDERGGETDDGTCQFEARIGARQVAGGHQARQQRD